MSKTMRTTTDICNDLAKVKRVPMPEGMLITNALNVELLLDIRELLQKQEELKVKGDHHVPLFPEKYTMSKTTIESIVRDFEEKEVQGFFDKNDPIEGTYLSAELIKDFLRTALTTQSSYTKNMKTILLITITALLLTNMYVLGYFAGKQVVYNQIYEILR